MCFNQGRHHFFGKHLKLADQFALLCGKFSSTESDVNKRIDNERIALDRQLILGKSEFSDKIKTEFTKLYVCQYYCIDAPSAL